MKRILTFFAALIFSLNVFSQAPAWQWAKGIGGKYFDAGESIATDAGGNVYTTGYFSDSVDFDPGTGVLNLISSGGSDDVFILKLNNVGNLVWAKSIGGPTNDEGKSIAIDPTNNDIYVAGDFTGTVDFDPGPAIYNLTSLGSFDIFICKLDSGGNFIWAKQMGGTDLDLVQSIALDHSGNICIAGSFRGTADFNPGIGISNLTSSGFSDIFVCELNPSGNFKWADAMGGPAGNDEANSIAISSSGNVYATGYFKGTVDFNPAAGVFNLTSTAGTQDIFILNLDSSGNFVWAKQFGGNGDYEYGQSIAIDTAGSDAIYITGFFDYPADFDPGIGTFNLTPIGNTDAFVLKLNSLGNFVWAKQIGGGGNNTFGDFIAISPSGNGDSYLLGDFSGTTDFNPGAGIFNLTSTGQQDIFISKLDASGNFLWAKSTGGTKDEIGLSIVLDFSENIYTTGYFNSTYIDFNSSILTNVDTAGAYINIFIAKLDTAITGINAGENPVSSILIYPNPLSSIATLTLGTNHSLEGNIEIKNILGTTVQQPRHFSGNTIKLQRNNLPAGIYFFRITTKTNEILNGKFIIN